MQQANDLYYYFRILYPIHPSRCLAKLTFAVWNLLTFELQPAHYDLWLGVCHCEKFQRISSSSIKKNSPCVSWTYFHTSWATYRDGIPVQPSVRHVNGRCNAMKGRRKWGRRRREEDIRICMRRGRRGGQRTSVFECKTEDGKRTIMCLWNL